MISPSGEYYFNRANARVLLKDYDLACEDYHRALHLSYNEAEKVINENCK